MRTGALLRIWAAPWFVIGLMLAGCGAETAPATPSTKRLSLAVIPKGTVHEFWKDVEAGVLEAAKELDVDVHWEGPTNETEHDRQRTIVDNMVSLGVDGIALAPTDEKALVRPVRAASRRGIPVVIFDSELDAKQGEDYISFVASDNEGGGRLAGRHMIDLLGPEGGKVVLVRFTEGSGSTLRREQGFLDAVAEAKQVEVADQQFTDGTTAGALTTATNMLTRQIVAGKLQVDGIFAPNLANTLGARRAIDRLKKQGVEVAVHLIGFDASEQLIAGLESGDIDALVVQDPRRMGYAAVATLVKALGGQKVPPRVNTKVELITRQRLQEPAIRTLLGLSPTQ
jgi:ribose transport system substrate-binding protein